MDSAATRIGGMFHSSHYTTIEQKNNNRKCRISLFPCLFTIPYQTEHRKKNVVSSFGIVASNVIHSFIHRKITMKNVHRYSIANTIARKNKLEIKIYEQIDTHTDTHTKRVTNNQAAFPVNCIAIPNFFLLLVCFISCFSSFIRISIMICMFIWYFFLWNSDYLAGETTTMHCRFHGDDLHVNT